MRRLRDYDLARHLRDPVLKPQFVTPMFDLVAPRYDDFTRHFSFGMDAGWKRILIRLALARAPGASRVLDLACGTGDLAFAVARAATLPAARVTAIDASRKMLACAAARAVTEPAHIAGRVAFELGNLDQLAADDASADLVTAGYAFRNAPALDAALAEAARVTRPGGVLAVLDFYRPAGAVWRGVFLGYLRAAGSLFGWLWHREPIAYGYIAHSIDAFVTAAEFRDALTVAGFDVVEERRYLGGGVAVHVARRRATRDAPRRPAL